MFLRISDGGNQPGKNVYVMKDNKIKSFYKNWPFQVTFFFLLLPKPYILDDRYSINELRK